MARLALPRRRAVTRRGTAVLAALLVLAPVAPVEAASSKRVTVVGQLRWPDGTPAARQHVELTRVTGLGDALGALFFFGLTGGLASVLCFDDEASDALVQCGKNTVATRTDAQGRYTFALSADVIDSPERTFNVTARVPRKSPKAAGAQLQLTTKLRQGRTTLPSLTFWQPRVTGPVDALSWTPLPGASGYAQSFSSPTGLQHETGGNPPLDLDARLLEDTKGTVVLSARGGSAARPVVWTAPRRGYTGTAGAPVTRRRRCTVTVETLAGPRAQPGCWLTDGRFATSYAGARPRRCFLDPDFVDPVFGERRRFCEYANVTAVEVDLGRVVDVEAVMTRGECDSCEVVTSVDHKTWTHPDTGTGPGFLVDWEGRPARWVRVFGDPYRSAVNRELVESPRAKLGGRRLPAEAPGDVSGLTELSVWEAAPAVPLETPSPLPSPTASPPLASPRHGDDEASTAAVLLAMLLLLGVAGGVVTTGAQRLRRS